MQRFVVTESHRIREGEIFTTRIHNTNVLLTRVEGRVHAVENRCAHLGLSMARGTVTGSRLRCPWHGAEYDVCSGRNLDWVNSIPGLSMPRWTHRLIALGRAPAALRVFATAEESGQVFIELPA